MSSIKEKKIAFFCKLLYNSITMKMTARIISAIKEAVDKAGGQLAFSQKTGVRQDSISKYLSGTNKSCEDDTWSRLEPHLRPYLTEGSKSAPLPQKAAPESFVCKITGRDECPMDDGLRKGLYDLTVDFGPGEMADLIKAACNIISSRGDPKSKHDELADRGAAAIAG
jgi:hypothetical protein